MKKVKILYKIFIIMTMSIILICNFQNYCYAKTNMKDIETAAQVVTFFKGKKIDASNFVNELEGTPEDIERFIGYIEKEKGFKGILNYRDEYVRTEKRKDPSKNEKELERKFGKSDLQAGLTLKSIYLSTYTDKEYLDAYDKYYAVYIDIVRLKQNVVKLYENKENMKDMTKEEIKEKFRGVQTGQEAANFLGAFGGADKLQQVLKEKGFTQGEIDEIMQKIEYCLNHSEYQDNDTDKDVEKYTGDTIYSNPLRTSDTTGAEESLDDMVSDAESFVQKGTTKYGEESLQNFSKTLYNIFLTIGVFVAVIIGGIIGIKLMTAGIEEKAQTKELLLPYVIGCITVFGGFAIWKIVVTILQGI